ncbi:hypothetical protein A2630_04850 [Candidatus Woesebacteria bacterium RIFCSPHIGHO2_01_FULL_44_10]|uniref:Uncharacterized protein n=1 Tax=Candidatus Woesebacteria bacterium RIFCSPLOWO2_01_FULL_44_14 TaxID=1802525 RepID=A0A1F8BZY9_9BACT|nr:MAG: hypothetical protein A2630_04850 [Candidatus Woesebacteria bacterium RIFCSPHIGHO2_01_FULL_44_10]OGM54759.1 MAG: hypothetical protein A3F62_01665 [Candidatus Woesebacteria bacterium RIFCSPHIGHO2_12_FULL_44_11]OGM69663.1 MAG: hypothetical protein A2975_00950 [Candidatus Woesebacteria bacterium RIFCSPLOWO2_01_FULL_44_14]
MIFVNFKTYPQGTGQAALNLVRILEGVSASEEIKIIPVLQAADIKEAVGSSKLEIWVQNISSFESGAHTGSVLAEAVVEDGAAGTFLNHSENKTDFNALSKARDRARAVGLKTLIFAANLDELKQILGLKPDFVSYEPPELVGSQTTSVAEARPEVISQAVEISRTAGLPLIVGAGIKSAADVRKSIELGASGVAVASDIVIAQDPRQELLDLIEGFK